MGHEIFTFFLKVIRHEAENTVTVDIFARISFHKWEKCLHGFHVSRIIARLATVFYTVA